MKQVLLLLYALIISGCATTNGNEYIGTWDGVYKSSHSEIKKIVKIKEDGTVWARDRGRGSASGLWRVDKDNKLSIFLFYKKIFSMKATKKEGVLSLSTADNLNHYTLKRKEASGDEGYIGLWVGTHLLPRCRACKEGKDIPIVLKIDKNGLGSFNMKTWTGHYAWITDKSGTLMMYGNLKIKAEIIDGNPVFSTRRGKPLNMVKRNK